MGTGIDAAMLDAALQIARLSDITPESLNMFEGGLLLASAAHGFASIYSMQSFAGGHLSGSRLETLFFAAVQAGALKLVQRVKRGPAYDMYGVDRDRLREFTQRVSVVRAVLDSLKNQESNSSYVELIATLPKDLPLERSAEYSIFPLSAALHRLIVESEKEIVILSPFFEKRGFEFLASALLSAARRGVNTTIISRKLEDTDSPNFKTISAFVRRAAAEGQRGRFRIYEYLEDSDDNGGVAFHAKVMLADERVAYIGSANLTGRGMADRLEIGVLLRGPVVRIVGYLVRAVLQSGKIQTVDM